MKIKMTNQKLMDYIDACELISETNEDIKKMSRILYLKEQRQQALKIKAEVEQWMNTVPVRMQRIIRFKFFEKLSWEQVAAKMRGKATGDSVRMEFKRFMKEN